MSSPLIVPSAAPAFWFTTEGAVRSKSNFRRYEKKGRSWQAYRSFEQVVALLCAQARPPGWELGEKSAPLATRPRVVAAIFAHTTLDAGNVPKSVLDACEGVVYHNDASVACVLVSTRRVREGAAHVGFARFDGPPEEAHIAAAELMSALLAAVSVADAA